MTKMKQLKLFWKMSCINLMPPVKFEFENAYALKYIHRNLHTRMEGNSETIFSKIMIWYRLFQYLFQRSLFYLSIYLTLLFIATSERYKDYLIENIYMYQYIIIRRFNNDFWNAVLAAVKNRTRFLSSTAAICDIRCVVIM